MSSKTASTLAVLVATAALTIGSRQVLSGPDELEGGKPYVPSRLEWLATHLNAFYRVSLSRETQYSLTYVAVHDEDAILIYVRYYPQADRETVNGSIENAKELIKITARSKGWIAWLKVKENVEMYKSRGA